MMVSWLSGQLALYSFFIVMGQLVQIQDNHHVHRLIPRSWLVKRANDLWNGLWSTD